MQKNLYYRAIARRENMFKLLLLSFFNFFSSYARLLLEVFTRKNFGERYFRLSSAGRTSNLQTRAPLDQQSISFTSNLREVYISKMPEINPSS